MRKMSLPLIKLFVRKFSLHTTEAHFEETKYSEAHPKVVTPCARVGGPGPDLERPRGHHEEGEPRLRRALEHRTEYQVEGGAANLDDEDKPT